MLILTVFAALFAMSGILTSCAQLRPTTQAISSFPSAAVDETPTPSPGSSITPQLTYTPTSQLVSPSPSLAFADNTSTTTSTPIGTPTPDTRPKPDSWRTWPVIPTLSAAARQIYLKGIQMGNDTSRFSTVGDCQSEPNVFLGIYATDRYFLGDNYQYLQETINFFHDSFGRKSLSVRDGLSAPSALTPLWADHTACEPTENPVACELRTYHPSLVFVNLGTNWKAGASAERYGAYLRQIVDLLISQGSLPILSTKADNVEGDNSLNRETAQVAYDYGLPLWNLWRAVQDLPNHGLDSSREDIYLTTEAWDRRSFTALEVLDALRKSLGNSQ